MTEDFAGILSGILDVGELMLTAGAEVGRVEETLQRMADAYGCVRADVFTITSSIVMTVCREDGQVFTQTRRIHTYETDMDRIEQCNRLSRRVCDTPLSEEALNNAVAEIKKGGPYAPWLICVGYCCVAMSFAVFFGGSFFDGLAASICSVLLFFTSRYFQRIRLQKIVATVLASGIVALGAVGLTRLGLGSALDKICIGNVMLLIPGIAFVTSLRDVISGDTISGLLGVSEAILRALAIAVGFAVVLWIFGGAV